MQHVFIVGAKSFGAYGGYETFVNKLTEYHQNNNKIKYHVACKANGNGCMADESKLEGVQILSDTEFIYHNAHCFKIRVPNAGSAQAIFYDVASLRYCCEYIKEHKIEHPIVYVLACRIGPFIGRYRRWIHRLGGELYINPDGHEWMRTKWPWYIRRYWKYSEKTMVRQADLVVCDSTNIEKYIMDNYGKYHVKTTYIAYGAETRESMMDNDNPTLSNWYERNGLRPKEYYLVVGRFVPENNYEIMIREFMKSKSKKDFAIITNVNKRFIAKLEKKLRFAADKRIKFVGTVYDQEMLMKIRQNAYAYFHGHEVGGTNPSLLEGLGCTDLNLLLDVKFNREVAADTALYWSKKKGELASLIDKADAMSAEEIAQFGVLAKARINSSYNWEFIGRRFEEIFLHNPENK